MSARRVDVLAVMDGHADGIAQAMQGRSARWLKTKEIEEGLAEFREARAVVAELIEALRGAPCYCEDGTGGEEDITCDRCAALARCGGGS